MVDEKATVENALKKAHLEDLIKEEFHGWESFIIIKKDLTLEPSPEFQKERFYPHIINLINKLAECRRDLWKAKHLKENPV